MVETYLIPMLHSAVYLLAAFLLLVVAKFAYGLVYRRVDLKEELFVQKNSALAVSLGGYLLGIVIALGGALSGPSVSWQADLTGIAIYGLTSIVLMLVASVLCEKVLLPQFNNTKEVVEDRNLGTAFVEAGQHIANGLIILAITQGSGPWVSGLAFWALGQLVLILAGLFYEFTTPHKVHVELERDNAAVGLAFGGVLVGMGNIISITLAGDFAGWGPSLAYFGLDVVFGFIVLYAIKKMTDLLLAPGIKLSAQQTAGAPNLGAGLLEAFGYIGGSMLIVWVF